MYTPPHHHYTRDKQRENKEAHLCCICFWLAKIRKPTIDNVRKTEKMVAKEVNLCLKIFLKPSAIKNENLSILRPHGPILNFNNSVTSAFN